MSKWKIVLTENVAIIGVLTALVPVLLNVVRAFDMYCLSFDVGLNYSVIHEYISKIKSY